MYTHTHIHNTIVEEEVLLLTTSVLRELVEPRGARVDRHQKNNTSPQKQICHCVTESPRTCKEEKEKQKVKRRLGGVENVLQELRWVSGQGGETRW